MLLTWLFVFAANQIGFTLAIAARAWLRSAPPGSATTEVYCSFVGFSLGLVPAGVWLALTSSRSVALVAGALIAGLALLALWRLPLRGRFALRLGDASVWAAYGLLWAAMAPN